jgi:hypothetical protein
MIEILDILSIICSRGETLQAGFAFSEGFEIIITLMISMSQKVPPDVEEEQIPPILLPCSSIIKSCLSSKVSCSLFTEGAFTYELGKILLTSHRLHENMKVTQTLLEALLVSVVKKLDSCMNSLLKEKTLALNMELLHNILTFARIIPSGSQNAKLAASLLLEISKSSYVEMTRILSNTKILESIMLLAVTGESDLERNLYGLSFAKLIGNEESIQLSIISHSVFPPMEQNELAMAKGNLLDIFSNSSFMVLYSSFSPKQAPLTQFNLSCSSLYLIILKNELAKEVLGKYVVTSLQSGSKRSMVLHCLDFLDGFIRHQRESLLVTYLFFFFFITEWTHKTKVVIREFLRSPARVANIINFISSSPNEKEGSLLNLFQGLCGYLMMTAICNAETLTSDGSLTKSSLFSMITQRFSLKELIALVTNMTRQLVIFVCVTKFTVTIFNSYPLYLKITLSESMDEFTSHLITKALNGYREIFIAFKDTITLIVLEEDSQHSQDIARQMKDVIRIQDFDIKEYSKKLKLLTTHTTYSSQEEDLESLEELSKNMKNVILEKEKLLEESKKEITVIKEEIEDLNEELKCLKSSFKLLEGENFKAESEIVRIPC